MGIHDPTFKMALELKKKIWKKRSYNVVDCELKKSGNKPFHVKYQQAQHH